MASIFNALHIGYSGLNAAQIGIDATGHNIANAETEGYSRQRVVTAAAYPISITPGERGNGTQITEIVRIFDSFVYGRYVNTAQNKENSDTLKNNLQTLSTYFPDIEKVGIKTDMQSYFDMWQSFASNPSNSAVKVALGQQAQTLTQHIQQTRAQVTALQDNLNDQVKMNVEEFNRIGQQIANLNKSIAEAEAGGVNNANDLRDQRSQLELTMAKLMGSKVMVGQIESQNTVNSNIAIKQGSYTIQVNGFNIVDGGSFHPIGIDNQNNPHGYNDLYYERQDGVRIPFAEKVTGGKVGALLELRGSKIGVNGEFEDGIIQATVNDLDTFAKGLIESTNNLYAQSATDKMRSNNLAFNDTIPLLSTDGNFKAGTFDIVLYDINGVESARRSITINAATVMNNAVAPNLLPDGTPNSIVQQIAAFKDDNADNNALNDIDDILNPVFTTPPNMFSIDLKSSLSGYRFGLEDHGTNFAGVTGVSRFFDGDSAKNIQLTSELRADPTLIRGFKAPSLGDNQTALDMVQLQFSSIEFKNGLVMSTDTLYGNFDTLVTRIGTKANTAIQNNATITAQFNAVKQEQDSISKVGIDEEMANLIRYQTSYGAAAKVITTIDQMMTTLLGIKN